MWIDRGNIRTCRVENFTPKNVPTLMELKKNILTLKNSNYSTCRNCLHAAKPATKTALELRVRVWFNVAFTIF